MDRDWMTTGRRPSGLCGASILIAARLHGYKRSIKEITSVVHVCDETIRRRLEEFANTTTAFLTMQEFDDNNIEGEGKNPPAYIKNRKKEKMDELYKRKAREIERILLKKNVNLNMSVSYEEGSTLDHTFVSDKDNLSKLNKDSLSKLGKDNKDFKAPSLSITNTNTSTITNTITNTNNIREEDLSDIDDKEFQTYFVSSEEYKIKKLLWDTLFDDWIFEQKERKKAKRRENKKRDRSQNKIGESDPVKSIISSNKFKKLNPNVLTKLFKNNK